MIPYLQQRRPGPRGRSAGSSTCCSSSTSEHLAAARPRPGARSPHPGDGDGLPHADRGARDAFDISREPVPVREVYGAGHFANACLLARRLAERGVRFMQVYYGDGQPWDTHSNHQRRPRASCARTSTSRSPRCSTDLKQRGLLDDTLVIWGGEFGRTPTTRERRTAATTTTTASPCGWPAAA